MNILLIPDIQAKPGQNLRFLGTVAAYIADKRPDCVVCIGDLFDYPSLSSYDRGKKAAEGKRLVADHAAGLKAANLITPRVKGYSPRLVFTAGNHEYRSDRYQNDYPELEGSLPDYRADMRALGWDVHDFLTPVKIEGVYFCHFFPRTLKGTVTAAGQRNGAPNAEYMVRANMASCVAGHKQGLDTASYTGIDGRVLRGVIAGSCYKHDEHYMGAQGNHYWRGVVMLNNVKKGSFDINEVSLKYLKKRYG